MIRVATIIVLSVALLGVVIAGVVAYGVNHSPAQSEAAPVRFTVASGEAFKSINERLHARGLVEHPRALALYAWVRGYDRRVNVGTYEFTPGESAKQVLGKLVGGDVHKISVTVPEGFMLTQIAGVLAARLDEDSTAFADIVAGDELISELGLDVASLEGYLFPDTYIIPWGLDPKSIVRLMVGRLEQAFDERAAERAASLGMTRHEVLTLASIVEAETRLSEELTLVSAVYHNRLRRGMKLEADPTVAYAMGGHKGRLWFKHLEIDSPYNTYKNRGLPPGPICSPGKAAIDAALYPDTATTALYFVARGDGGHVFSRTLREHNAAVQARKARLRERTNRD